MFGNQLTWTTGSQSLQFVLFVALCDLYIYKDFVWELLYWVIYKTLYEKIYVMNDEIKLTCLLFSIYLSVLCRGPFGAILSNLLSVTVGSPSKK